jgi:hypothetical protein
MSTQFCQWHLHILRYAGGKLMLTLYTLPLCPRCDMVKSRLNELGIEYKIGTDTQKISEYNDLFWPILVDENGVLRQFPDIVKFLTEESTKSKIEKGS